MSETPEPAPKGEPIQIPYIIEEIFFERVKQIQKGYDDASDDRFIRGELPLCAMAYAMHGGNMNAKQHKDAGLVWPLPSNFNPSSNRRNLIKAAAMLIAEIERLDRYESTVARDVAEQG